MKNFGLLVPQLLKEAENWSNEIRTQTAQLLWQMLLESPDRRLELDTVMEIVVFQSGDEELTIRQYVNQLFFFLNLELFACQAKFFRFILFLGFEIGSTYW